MMQGVLNAMEGVCYLVGFDGAILALGERNWDEVASACDAVHLHSSKLSGKNIFQHIAGEDVSFVYRQHLRRLQTGREHDLSFSFRCDAPGLRREMRMNLSTIHEEERPAAVLFQSSIVSEHSRPPINLFASSPVSQEEAADLALPFVTLCSFCHAVKVRPSAGRWQTAEQYYQSGGSERVRVSHGICSPCFEDHRSKS